MRLLSSLALAALVALPAQAQSANNLGLRATGVDAAGTRLASGAIDPHWRIVTPSGTSNAVVVNALDANNPCRLANTWVAPASPSCWIWGSANGQPTNTSLTFRTTFDLTGFVAGTATISGKWAADNQGISILLNGVELPGLNTGGTGEAFRTLYDFTIAAGNPNFRAGVNTLDFVVRDNGVVGGFLVSEIAGSATVVPEPSTYALLATGLVGLGVAARRRRAAGR